MYKRQVSASNPAVTSAIAANEEDAVAQGMVSASTSAVTSATAANEEDAVAQGMVSASTSAVTSATAANEEDAVAHRLSFKIIHVDFDENDEIYTLK